LLGGELSVGELELGSIGPGALEVLGPWAELDISRRLTLGPEAELSAEAGVVVHLSGAAFEDCSTAPSALAGLGNLILIFEGGGGAVDPFEVAGRDLGAVAAGLAENFALASLRIGGRDVGRLRLVDLFDNTPDWEGPEALYVCELYVSAGSLLDLNGLNLYYLHAELDPGATILTGGGRLLPVPEPAVLVLLAVGGCALLFHRRADRRG